MAYIIKRAYTAIDGTNHQVSLVAGQAPQERGMWVDLLCTKAILEQSSRYAL
jgi:hypothetical protein